MTAADSETTGDQGDRDQACSPAGTDGAGVAGRVGPEKAENCCELGLDAWQRRAAEEGFLDCGEGGVDGAIRTMPSAGNEGVGPRSDPRLSLTTLWSDLSDRNANAGAHEPAASEKANLVAGQETTLEPGETVSGKEAGDWAGKKIGAFTLGRRIGGGGGGVVYEAVQGAPVERRVAVKLLNQPVGLDGRRWETEAQAMGAVQHPNLISIIDAGVTSEGLPYLVMPLVDGVRIDSWVESGKTAPREIARVMLEVARGVAHAHERNILHRDLKPGNVLVTADGMPVVTDFGLAKWLEADPDKSATQSGATMGSIGFLAPEQVLSSSVAATPAVDVYGWGATLYRLLTGTPPTRTENWAVCMDDLRNREPTMVRRLRPGVPRDLESVCLKCLEKNPVRRYPSMAAVVEDVERFLAGQPVIARPVGRRQRLWRWALREPVVAGLTVAISMLLLAGSIVFGWLWQNSEQNRRRIDDDLDRALALLEEQASNAREMLQTVPNALAFRQKQLESTIRNLLELRGKNPGEEQIERHLARNYYRLGMVCHYQQDLDGTNANLAESARRYRQLVAKYPHDEEASFGLFHTLKATPQNNWKSWEAGDEAPFIRESLPIIEQLAVRHPMNPDYQDALAASLAEVAKLEALDGEKVKARQMYERSIAIARKLTAEFPDRPMFQKHIASGLWGLANLEIESNRLDRAKEQIAEAVTVWRKLAAATPDIIDNRRFLGVFIAFAARVEVLRGNRVEAAKLQSEAVGILDRATADYPDWVAFQDSRDAIVASFARFLAGGRE